MYFINKLPIQDKNNLLLSAETQNIENETQIQKNFKHKRQNIQLSTLTFDNNRHR